MNRPHRTLSAPRRLLPLVALLCLLPSGATGARPAGAGSTAQDFLSAVARAWTVEDHAALSGLIAPEGAEIALGPQPGVRRYTASQAFYLFKTVFQASDTESFRFSLQGGEPDSGRAHAVADWTHRRAGAEEAVVERLMFTLVRGEAGWGLTVIRVIR